MAIFVVCPSCQGKMHAPDNAGGRTVQCPKCGEITTVPGAAAVNVEALAPQPAPQPPVMQARVQAPPESWRPLPAEGSRRDFAPAWDEDDDYERKADRDDGYDDYRSERFRRGGPYHPDVFRKLFRYGLICFLVAAALCGMGAVILIAATVFQESSKKYDSRVGYVRTDPAAKQQADTMRLFAGPAFLLAVPFYIAMYVLFLILLYKEWNLIQDGRARTTPGMAVGLLFVPLFNLYWIFMAYYGLAVDMNNYSERHRIHMKRVPDGIVLTWCILLFGAIIPCVGPLIALGNLIMFFIMQNALKNGAVAIATAQRDYSPELGYDM